MAQMIFIAIGRQGDVDPMLGITGKRKQLGHEVIFTTNLSFKSMV